MTETNLQLSWPSYQSHNMYCLHRSVCTQFQGKKSSYHRSGNFRCKKHEIYFTMDNHCSQNIFVCTISQHSWLVISRETVSLIPACHSSSWQMRKNSVLYCHSTCLRRYWVPFCTLVAHQQLHRSHERSMQAVRTLSVHSFVPDH